jgi:hypothetical protein
MAKVLFLSHKNELSIDKSHLIEVNQAANKDFDNTTFHLLKEEVAVPSGSIFKGLSRDLVVAYVVRNRAAHNLGPIQQPYWAMQRILASIFNALFLAVEAVT